MNTIDTTSCTVTTGTTKQFNFNGGQFIAGAALPAGHSSRLNETARYFGQLIVMVAIGWLRALQGVAAALSMPPSRPPTVGIPVVSQGGAGVASACH